MSKMQFVSSAALVMAFLPGATLSAAAPDTIKIGVFEPMTGGMAAGGQQSWEGIQLANEQAKTVLGKRVQLVLVDNKSDKVEAATAMSRLINSDKVVGVIGSYGSSLSMAGGEVSERAGIPVIGDSPTNPLVTKGKQFYFRVCFIDPFQGSVMAKYAFSNLHAKRVAIIQDVAQDYSVGLSNYFRNKWLELSGDPKSLVAFTSYQSGDVDFTAQLNSVMSKHPDVIFSSGYYGEAGMLAKQAREMGFQGMLLGGDAWDAPELIQVAGAAGEGMTFSTHYDPAGGVTPSSKRFVDAYKAKYHKDPNAFAALGYDAYMLMLDGISRAKSTNGKAIRDQIAATKRFEGVTGYITIDADHNAVKEAVIKTVKNGNFAYVTAIQP